MLFYLLKWSLIQSLCVKDSVLLIKKGKTYLSLKLVRYNLQTYIQTTIIYSMRKNVLIRCLFTVFDNNAMPNTHDYPETYVSPLWKKLWYKPDWTAFNKSLTTYNRMFNVSNAFQYVDSLDEDYVTKYVVTNATYNKKHISTLFLFHPYIKIAFDN
jgi:hypothetical protein